MEAAVSSALGVVQQDCGCACHCPSVYRSDKDRICDGLFGKVPLGTDSEDIVPDITVWKDGVEMVGAYDNGMNVFSFIIEEDEEGDPKVPDVIMYEGRLYIIGEVHTVVDPYLEIEPETIWVYPDWAVDNDVYSNTKWNVK